MRNTIITKWRWVVVCSMTIMLIAFAGCSTPMEVSVSHGLVADLNGERIIELYNKTQFLWPMTVEGPFPRRSDHMTVYTGRISETRTLPNGESWTYYDRIRYSKYGPMDKNVKIAILEGCSRIRIDIAKGERSVLETFSGEITGSVLETLSDEVSLLVQQYNKLNSEALVDIANQSKDTVLSRNDRIPVADVAASILRSNFTPTTDKPYWGMQMKNHKTTWSGMAHWGKVRVRFSKYGEEGLLEIFRFSEKERREYAQWCKDSTLIRR